MHDDKIKKVLVTRIIIFHHFGCIYGWRFKSVFQEPGAISTKQLIRFENLRK